MRQTIGVHHAGITIVMQSSKVFLMQDDCESFVVLLGSFYFELALVLRLGFFFCVDFM
jgi:hypothetical protein